MRFSIWPNLQQPWDDVAAIAHHADTTGWDGIYLADHFMGDAGGFGPVETPTFEATAGIAALAASTSNVRLGTLVLGMTYRHPAVVANWAATVDHISDGRLLLGVGAGWQENEHQQYGIDLPPVKQRVDRFAEGVEVLDGLLRQPVTSIAGAWYQLDEAVCEPKPVQPRLPLLIGGKGNRMLGIVARYADEWNMWSTPETIAERGAELTRRCELIDRDPGAIAWSTQAVVMLTDDESAARQFEEALAPRPAIGGTVERVAEVVAGWKDAGVADVIIPDFVLGRGAKKLDAMDALIEHLGPAFR
jgi:F420-dependent oxidoreductase-like protein